MPFSKGENVGPYRIVEQLGQGGMASVFKAYHPALDRYVAIKVLHPAFMEDPSFLARFQREARVVAKLDHPNIVPIYDFAEHEGQPYLVMKYIQGETLKARLARSPLGPDDGLKVIEAIGHGLSYAHEQGILHRDIKPSNVLLGADGHIYLADFGLARIAQAGESTLSNDMLLGTPQYISPEQARGERELDEGTDIYSFGVLIYEMVVGRVPFNADTPFSIVHDHIYTPLPMPRSVNPKVPEAIERVLLKALAKDRADRFASVGDMVNALHGALQGRDLPSAAVSLPDATRSSEGSDAPKSDAEAELPAAGKRRWLWVAGGLGLACICLFAFLVVVNRINKSNPGSANAPASQPAPLTLPASGSAATLAAARGAVATNPADPDAQLALAKSLAESGQTAGAWVALQAAVQTLRDRGQAGRATQALVTGLEMMGGPKKAEPGLVDATLQALFLAASKPDQVGPTLDRLQVEYSDWPQLQAVGSRADLYRGEADTARRTAQQALDLAPGDPIIQSVLAEIDASSGDKVRARGTIDDILSKGDVPRWLRVFLTELKRNLVSTG
ncbi:MAG: tetratricopeptide repeat protein [Anaerolineales bacterium]|jgi:serine/threonine protein kinase